MITPSLLFSHRGCTTLCFSVLIAWGQLSAAAPAETQPANKPPKKVYVSLAFNSISDINEVEQTFYADFYMRLRWEDSTYANHAKEKKERLDSPPEWRPSPDFTNAQEVTARYDEVIYEVLEPGIVQSLDRYSGTFRMKADLTRFPFDTQDLRIAIEDEMRPMSELVFIYEAPGSAHFGGLKASTENLQVEDFLEEELRLPEWHLVNITTSTREHFYELVFDSASFSQFRVTIHLKRHLTYYITKIIGVALLILALAVPAFFVSPGDLGTREAFVLTLFLAIVAHNYVVSTMLPIVSYLTALDYILVGSQILLFIAALEHLCVYRIAVQGGHEATLEGLRRARKIDRVFICVFSAVIVLFPVTVWYLATL